MIKKLKWILGGLFALAVALVVAVVATLSSLEFEDLRALAEAEAEAATGRKLSIAGPVDLKISATPVIRLENITFANAPWSSQPQMASVKQFELEVALFPLLSGEIKVKRLVVVAPEILLERGPDGHGNWQLEIAEGGESASASDDLGGFLPSFEKILLRDGRVTYRDNSNGKEWQVQLDELSGSAEGFASPVKLAAKGRYNGAPVELTGSLGSLKAYFAGPSVPLSLTAGAGGALASFDGLLVGLPDAPARQGAFTLSGSSLADLSPLLGVTLPALGPYDLKAQGSERNGDAEFSALSLTLGGSDLTGSGSLSIFTERPLFKGDYSAKVIDLKDLGAGSGGGAANSPYVFTEELLPFSDLNAVDVAANLTAKSVRVTDKLAFSDLDAKIDLKAGHLKLTPLASGFAGGRLTGAIDLQAAKEPPALAVNLKGRRLDYGQLLRDFGEDNTVTGVMDVVLDLKGRGSSERALAAGLNGRTEILSNQGNIDDRVLKILAVGLGDVLGPLFGEERNSRLNCIVSRFSIKKGLATSQALVMDSQAVTLVGEGSIDLTTERLDMVFDTETREPSLASLAVPFKVIGPLKDPQVVPDPLGAAANVIGTVGVVADTVGSLVGDLGSLVGVGGNEEAPASENNPCLAALSAAAKPAAQPAAQPASTEQSGGSSGGSVGDSIGKALDNLGNDLKSLFD